MWIKVNNMRSLKKISFLFCPVCFWFSVRSFFFTVEHFAAEELRHVRCRISRTPGSPTWPVPVYINFPPGGRSSQSAPRAVQTLPLASVPYTASSGAGWMAIFLGTGSYVVGRSNMFQHCLSSDNYCDGHLGTADWRSWVLMGGT